MPDKPATKFHVIAATLFVLIAIVTFSVLIGRDVFRVQKTLDTVQPCRQTEVTK